MSQTLRTRETHWNDFKLLAQLLKSADEARWKIFVFLIKLLLELCESTQQGVSIVDSQVRYLSLLPRRWHCDS